MPLHELTQFQLHMHFQTHDSIGHLEMFCIHERLITEWCRWVWMEMLQLTAQRWKNTKCLSTNPALAYYLLYKLSSLWDDIVAGLLPDQCITKQFQKQLSLFLQTHPIWRLQAKGQE